MRVPLLVLLMYFIGSSAADFAGFPSDYSTVNPPSWSAFSNGLGLQGKAANNLKQRHEAMAKNQNKVNKEYNALAKAYRELLRAYKNQEEKLSDTRKERDAFKNATDAMLRDKNAVLRKACHEKSAEQETMCEKDMRSKSCSQKLGMSGKYATACEGSQAGTISEQRLTINNQNGKMNALQAINATCHSVRTASCQAKFGINTEKARGLRTSCEEAALQKSWAEKTDPEAPAAEKTKAELELSAFLTSTSEELTSCQGGQEALVAEKDAALAEKDAAEAAREAAVAEKDAAAAEWTACMAEKEEIWKQKEEVAVERDTYFDEKEACAAQKLAVEELLAVCADEKEEIWKEKEAIALERDGYWTERDVAVAEKEAIQVERDDCLTAKTEVEGLLYEECVPARDTCLEEKAVVEGERDGYQQQVTEMEGWGTQLEECTAALQDCEPAKEDCLASKELTEIDLSVCQTEKADWEAKFAECSANATAQADTINNFEGGSVRKLLKRSRL